MKTVIAVTFLILTEELLASRNDGPTIVQLLYRAGNSCTAHIVFV